jgi:hypothetical protein
MHSKMIGTVEEKIAEMQHEIKNSQYAESPGYTFPWFSNCLSGRREFEEMGVTLAKVRARVDNAEKELEGAVGEANEFITRYKSAAHKRKFDEFGIFHFLYDFYSDKVQSERIVELSRK